MKQRILLLAAWCLAAPLFAQAPANDNCDSPIELGLAPTCTSDEYTNLNATPSDIGANNQPSCFGAGSPGNDVWFTFVCPPAPLDFRIQLTGTGADPISNPRFAVYRGDCLTDGLAELDCVAGTGADLFLDVQGLTPGAVYFIRVSSAGVPANAGVFNLCVNEIPPIVTIDQGGSTLCAGTLYDSGGPNDDYGPNEDHVFTICPSVPTACIDFTLSYFNLDAGGTFGPGFDVLTFYDGPTTGVPIAAQINGFSTTFGADGGGGVCFQVQAASGCLTVQFQSDATVQFEGFQGSWQCSDAACELPANIAVETAVTKTDIVTAIEAPGTTITLQDISKCPPGAYGTFEFATDNNDLGLRRGLVLTSGSADLVPGPNDNPGASQDNDAPGDAQLNYLSTSQGNGTLSLDACIIEMDIFVAADELAFEYVFGSEEYPEYVNNQYNDIFAFLASGPGIVGDPNLGGAQNIAVLPGTNTPVQINSVNNLNNWQYYRNNEVSQGSTLQYDGFTADFLGVKKSLTARVDVVPCNTYRLKLAVADRFDRVFDSGVFISEVRGGAPALSVEFASGLDYFIEDCSGTEDQLVIRLNKPKDKAVSYTITLGGSATQGVDYLLNIPAVITFQPGDTVLAFPIIPLADALTEGTETITITLSNDFGCGTVVFQTLTLELLDDAEVVVNGGADTIYVCPLGTAQLEAAGAQTYFWSPPLAVNNPAIANPTITPTQDIQLQVIGTIGSCSDTATVFVKIISTPTLDIQAVGSTSICQGDTLQLVAGTNAGEAGISWSPKSRLSAPNSAATLAYPLSITTYTATIQVPGCAPVTDEVTIDVDTLFFPTLAFSDTTVCQNYPVQLANVLQSTTLYEWSPTQGLDGPASSGPIATPDQTTTYTLTATSANGGCSPTATVTVNIISANVEILGADSLAICLGDTVSLSAQGTPSGATITWEPPFYVNPTTGPAVTTTPDESITVYANYNINGCRARDSVFIRVDSLPDLTIRLEPEKPIYCPGDTVYLLSNTYEPANFPGMTNAWEPFGGQLTPVENWNMVITATQTNTFRRVTESQTKACIDIAEVLVPVGIPPILTVSVNPTAICPGQSAQITLTVNPPNQAIEWEDPTGSLSCTDCLTPIAVPAVTTTYTVNTPGADCPASTNVTVVVLPLPALALGASTICLGNSMVLNDIATNPADTYTWTVVPPGDPASLSNPGVSNPTVNPTTTTTYSVVASGQCTNQGTVTVSVNSATISVGPDQAVCPGDPATLNATVNASPGATGTISWVPGPGTGPVLTVSPIATTTYTAVYTFQPNCTVLDSATVTVFPGVFLSEIRTDTIRDIICEGTRISLQVDVAPPGVSLVWYENGVPVPGATADSISVVPPGDAEPLTVAYTVVATDANGCSVTAGPFEQIVRRCIVFPNAFTPDGDGNNDTFGGFVTFGEEGIIEVLEFRVFNRWGGQVFEATSAQKSWDGRVNGKDSPSDVYAYYITVRFANGEEETYKGDVTLLR
ncbi:MAG: choice-of-anchor L domain-containing protein [Lewinellaceae bacterium]|nr:choice-of-anchor L domain-containing protein [Lewinellaceae bacterium]